MPSALAHLADWPLLYPTCREFGKFSGEVGIEGEEDMATVIKSDIRTEAPFLPAFCGNGKGRLKPKQKLYSSPLPSPGGSDGIVY